MPGAFIPADGYYPWSDIGDVGAMEKVNMGLDAPCPMTATVHISTEH